MSMPILKKEIFRAGEEIIGRKKGEGKTPWVTEEILRCMDETENTKLNVMKKEERSTGYLEMKSAGSAKQQKKMAVTEV